METPKNQTLPPAPADNSAEILALQNKLAEQEKRIAQITEAENAAKKQRIENAVAQLVKDCKIDGNAAAGWTEKALKDETVIQMLDKLPSNPPGAPPVPTVVDITSADIKDVGAFIMRNGPDFVKQFTGTNAGREITPQVVKDFSAANIARAQAINQHFNKLVAAFNTNTISTDIKRQVILQVPVLRAYKKRIIPLTAFCTVFNNVPLEGTNKIELPYYPLQTAASTSFSSSYSAGNTTVQSKEIIVDQRYYQALAFTSSELRRLPYVNWEQLAAINGEKLGYDVFSAAVAYLTAANYTSAAVTTPAAAFTSDDVSDLYSAATSANWPDTGRSLVLDHTYKAALLKDPAFKQYLSYGDTDPIRKAAIQEAYGFENIFTVPNLTALSPSGENLTGWINHASALLIATSPIMPTEDVRAVMSRYDVITDPDTGISIEYRRFGTASTDTTTEIVECNYGIGVGVATALQRIRSAA